MRDIPGFRHIRVKICGITQPEDARIAERCGADAIGIVMHSPSLRNVSAARAREIFSAVGPFVTRVVVTHTRHPAEWEEILQLRPDAVQISYGFPVVRGVRIIRVLTPGDRIRTDCDALVIDGSRGNGIMLDREFARQTLDVSPLPVILAGGLSPENVSQIICHLNPYAVDVCSGVEYAPGVKDPYRIRQFIRAVHHAGHAGQSPLPE